jgi:hypothetical protein
VIDGFVAVDEGRLSQLESPDISASEVSLVLTCSPSSMSVMKLKALDFRALLAVRLLLLLPDVVRAAGKCAATGG